MFGQVVTDFVPWQVRESLFSCDNITILRAEDGEILVRIDHHRPFFHHSLECVAMELEVVGPLGKIELVRGQLLLLSQEESIVMYAFDSEAFDDTGKFSFYYQREQPVSCNVARVVFTVEGKNFSINNASYHYLTA